MLRTRSVTSTISCKLRITSYNVCYTKLLRVAYYYFNDAYRVYYSDRNAVRMADYIRLDLAANINGNLLRNVITSYSIHYTKLYDASIIQKVCWKIKTPWIFIINYKFKVMWHVVVGGEVLTIIHPFFIKFTINFMKNSGISIVYPTRVSYNFV